MYAAFEVNLHSFITCNRGFHKPEEIGNNANIGIIGLPSENQKIQWQNITPKWG